MTDLKPRSKDLRNYYYNSDIGIFSKGLLSQEQLIEDLLDRGIDFQQIVRQIANRQSRDEVLNITFLDYEEYLKYDESDYSKVYKLALITAVRLNDPSERREAYWARVKG